MATTNAVAEVDSARGFTLHHPIKVLHRAPSLILHGIIHKLPAHYQFDDAQSSAAKSRMAQHSDSLTVRVPVRDERRHGAV